MRSTLSRLLTVVLLGASLSACAPGAIPGLSGGDAAAPGASGSPGTPSSADGKVPVPSPADGKPTGPSSAPADAKPPDAACTPDSSAAQLPSEPHGGVTLPASAVEGTPDRPRFGYLAIRQTETWQNGGGTMLGTVYAHQSGGVTVDTGAFVLAGDLTPAPSAEWYASHLQLTGVKPDREQYPPAGVAGGFDLQIPAGEPGEAFQLTLQGVLRGDGTTGDVTVNFCRQPAPKLTATYKDGDTWRPVNAYLPSVGPLTVRLAFTSDMFPATVERALRGPHTKDGGSQGDWITSLRWLDPRTVELTADKPAPIMQLNMSGSQDKSGLFVAGGAPNLYMGEPASVVAADPVAGSERRLAELPPEPQGGSLSPDGKWLRTTSQQRRGGSDQPDWQHLLVDLTSGKAKGLTPEESLGYWLPNSEVLTITHEGEDKLLLSRWSGAGKADTLISDLPSHGWTMLSPDGKAIAVLAYDRGNTAYPYIGGRFLILSTDGKERRTLNGDVQMYSPGKDGGFSHMPSWSPDGSRIALTQPHKDGISLVVADVGTGGVHTLVETLPANLQMTAPVSWSPDGSKILVGPVLIDAATGQVREQIAALGNMRPFWSMGSDWLLFQTQEWEEVTVYNLRTGKSTSLGAGLPLGWSPDGKALLIRWPGSAWRTISGI